MFHFFNFIVAVQRKLHQHISEIIRKISKARLTITLEECLILLSQPKKFGRRGPKPPLAQYGKDPESGKEITLREGKFGLYVSDGEYNASLRRGDSPETLTEGRAQELLAERRLQGPAKKKKSR